MSSLTYDQILFLYREIAPLIKSQNFIFISNVEERKFILEFSNSSLLICLQEPFIRFHLTNKKKQIKQSPFAGLINQTLEKSKLEDLEILNEDRILQFNFMNGKRFFLIAEFFQKKPNLYLLDSEKKILGSLNSSENEFYEVPEKKCSLKTTTAENFDSKTLEKLYQEKEIALTFEKKRSEVSAKIKATIKRLEKSKKTHENNLKNCCEWEKRQHKASLLQANFHLLKRGMHQINLIDWETGAEVLIELDKKLNAHDEIKKRFKEAKKLKVGIAHEERQIRVVEEQLKVKTEEFVKIESVTTLKELQRLFPEKEFKDKVEEKSLPYREYQSKAGYKILVGKNAASNDALTFKYAKGFDLWLHVKDYPGSHVVIRKLKGKDVDPETIADAVQLAIFYSKAKKMDSAEVCLTERKYVSRIGNKKDGKVQISKQKIIHARADKERFRALQGK